MMVFMKTFFAAVVLLLAVTAVPAGEAMPAAEAVRHAQDFTFEDINPASPTHGDTLTLSELWADEGLVLNFLASWCGYCWKELPHLQKMQDAGEARVFGMAADEYGEPRGLLLSMVERAKLTIPILWVPEERVAWLEQHYDHRMLPATYVIDRSGEIRRVMQGALPAEAIREEIARGLGG